MRPAAVLVLALAACTSSAPEGEPNPPQLWLAMDTGQSTMVLVSEEPHPY